MYKKLVFFSFLISGLVGYHPNVYSDSGAADKRLQKHIDALSFGTEQVKIRAIEALGKIGATAVPTLTKALEDPVSSVRISAAEALGGIGLAALPALTKALESSDVNVRNNTARSLGKLGPPAIPALMNAIKDPEQYVQATAAEALGELGPAAKEAVPALADVLDNLHDVDPDAEPSILAEKIREANHLRDAVIEALVRIGPVTLPVLAKAAKNSACDIHLHAVDALAKLGPLAIPALTEALQNPDAGVRGRAAEALASVGIHPESKEAIQALTKALDDSASFVRKAAVTVLGGVGPSVLPALAKTLQDPDGNVRCSAANALTKMGSAAVPALTEAFENSGGDFRMCVLGALGDIGPEAKDAVPALDHALKNPDLSARQEFIRDGGVAALGKIGTAAVPALIQALADPDSFVWKSAVSALGEIGPGAKEAVPALSKLFANPDTDERYIITAVFVKIGTASIPSLTEALQSPTAGIRSYAAQALGDIGPAARASIPRLEMAMKYSEASVAQTIGEALAKIRGPGKAQKKVMGDAPVKSASAKKSGEGQDRGCKGIHSDLTTLWVQHRPQPVEGSLAGMNVVHCYQQIYYPSLCGLYQKCISTCGKDKCAEIGEAVGDSLVRYFQKNPNVCVDFPASRLSADKTLRQYCAEAIGVRVER